MLCYALNSVKRPDTTIEVKSLIGSISSNRLDAFLLLEREEVPEFDAYVFRETGQKENDLHSEDYNKWRNLAQRFSGLATKGARGPIKKAIMQDMNMWDETRQA